MGASSIGASCWAGSAGGSSSHPPHPPGCGSSIGSSVASTVAQWHTTTSQRQIRYWQMRGAVSPSKLKQVRRLLPYAWHIDSLSLECASVPTFSRNMCQAGCCCLQHAGTPSSSALIAYQRRATHPKLPEGPLLAEDICTADSSGLTPSLPPYPISSGMDVLSAHT